MIAAETILGSSKHEELYYKQMIHSKNKGFITVAEKELEEFKQWHYKYSSLPSLVGKTDRYMSMNTFWKTYRRIEYLKELNTIYVDIDYYNTNFSKETVLRNLAKLVEEKGIKKRSPNSKLVRLFNIYNLNYTRIVDLITLCELRSFDLPSRRELVLFLYRLWSNLFCENKKIALERTLEINTQFSYPLSVCEATSATRSAEKAFDAWESGETVKWQGREVRKGYNYTNKTLIELLDITQEEQIHMKTIIGTAEKYRRNNEKRYPRNEAGLTSREQAKQDVLERLTKLRKKNPDMLHKDLAEILGVTRRYVSKLLRGN